MFSNSKLISFPFMLVVAAFSGGCGGNADPVSGWRIEGAGNSVMHGPGEPPVWSIINRNVLEPSALMRGSSEPTKESIITPNSLDPSALVPTDLGRYPLSIGGMSPATAELVTGPEGTKIRALLQYAVACALAPDKPFEFSWTDGGGLTHEAVYHGSLGIAPEWSTRALKKAEQEWVSACLAAKANWYGEEIAFSMRGGHGALEFALDDEEILYFTKREATFWGNLFSPTPYLRACYDEQNIAHSRLARRECAAGHVEADGSVTECGMIDIVGSCQQTCQSVSTDGYYTSCDEHRPGSSPNAQTHRVITTFLH